MCLLTNKKRCDEFKAANKVPFIWAYKVIKLEENWNYRPPKTELKSYFRCYSWKQGWNKANGNVIKTKQIKDDNSEIHQGIHVYLTKKCAINMHNFRYDNRLRLVKVKCWMRDFVAAGVRNTKQRKTNEAVFKRVFLTKEEYNKAMQKVVLAPITTIG